MLNHERKRASTTTESKIEQDEKTNSHILTSLWIESATISTKMRLTKNKWVDMNFMRPAMKKKGSEKVRETHRKREGIKQQTYTQIS